MPTLIGWLQARLDWAAGKHPAVDEFDAEMRDLVRELREVCGTTRVRPERLDVPCRHCGTLALTRLPGQDRIECGMCGDLTTEDEYRRWCGLLVAQHA